MSNEYVIIGIDPGLMTGVYMFGPVRGRNYSTGDHIPVEDFPMRFGSSLNGILGWVVKMCEPRNVHIAIERYIITPKTAKLSQQTEALEVTGMAKGFAALAGITDVRQYAKANLKFASDDMLKAVGWWNPKMRHANDAARQAFALLKDIDYPRWSELVRDAKMEPTTEG